MNCAFSASLCWRRICQTLCKTFPGGPCLKFLLVEKDFLNAFIFQPFSRESFFKKKHAFIQSSYSIWRTSPTIADGDWVGVSPIYFVNNRTFVFQTIRQLSFNISSHPSIKTMENPRLYKKHVSTYLCLPIKHR